MAHTEVVTTVSMVVAEPFMPLRFTQRLSQMRKIVETVGKL